MHVTPNHSFPFGFRLNVPWLTSLLSKTGAKAILPVSVSRDHSHSSKLIDELHWELAPILEKYLRDADCQALSFCHEFWSKCPREGILNNHHAQRLAGVVGVIQKLKMVEPIHKITQGHNSTWLLLSDGLGAP